MSSNAFITLFTRFLPRVSTGLGTLGGWVEHRTQNGACSEGAHTLEVKKHLWETERRVPWALSWNPGGTGGATERGNQRNSESAQDGKKSLHTHTHTEN